MNRWETTERFDAIVLNNSLSYSIDPREMFERALGWLAEDGFLVAAMYRGLGARYIWSLIEFAEVEQVAACAVKDVSTGAVWDVKALRPRPSQPGESTSWNPITCEFGARPAQGSKLSTL
jgi:hypothetical protein